MWDRAPSGEGCTWMQPWTLPQQQDCHPISQSQIVEIFSRSLMSSLAMLLTALKEQPSILQDCVSPPAPPGKPPRRRRALCRMHGKIWMAHRIHFAASTSKKCRRLLQWNCCLWKTKLRHHLERCWGVCWAALGWW